MLYHQVDVFKLQAETLEIYNLVLDLNGWRLKKNIYLRDVLRSYLISSLAYYIKYVGKCTRRETVRATENMGAVRTEYEYKPHSLRSGQEAEWLLYYWLVALHALARWSEKKKETKRSRVTCSPCEKWQVVWQGEEEGERRKIVMLLCTIVKLLCNPVSIYYRRR